MIFFTENRKPETENHIAARSRSQAPACKRNYRQSSALPPDLLPARYCRGTLFLGGIFFISLLLLVPASCRTDSQVQIKVFSLSKSPQVEQVCAGLRQGLGLPTLAIIEAGGDEVLGKKMATQLAAEKLQLLIVLGTPALRLIAPRHKRQPVVFAMVADPYFTGAAYDRTHPEIHQESITGLASPPPLAEALQQGNRLFPAYRDWGMLYDPLEGSSVELSRKMIELARQIGLSLTVLPLTADDQAQASLQKLLAQGVRVIFLPPDRNAGRYGELLLQWGREAKVVVINGNPGFLEQGAVLSITLDYQTLGEKAAVLAQRVLRGEAPAKIPIMQESPLKVQVDEKLLARWSSYPPKIVDGR
jgi:putative ABC transport system substrate-binding protein